MRYSLADLQIIQEVLNCNEIAMCSYPDSKTELFERKIKKYFSVDFAVAISSGTAALHLALLSAGVGVGDEVLVDPLFEYGALATLRCNAIPVFYDVNADTYMPDVSNLISRISPRTKAVIVTNVFGCAANLPAIREFCDRLKLILIEDCAHAITSKCYGKYVGTYGDIGVLSFHSSLHLSLGSGGAILTSNKTLYTRILNMRNQITSDQTDVYGNYYPLGWGYKISELVSAIGITQLDILDKIIDNYKAIGNWISTNLQSPYIIAQKCYYSDHVFWKWAGRIDDAILFGYLEERFKGNKYLKFGINNKTIVNDWDEFQNFKKEDIYTCPYDCIFARENCKEAVNLDNARVLVKQLLIIEIKYGTPLEEYKNLICSIKDCINEYLSDKKSHNI